MRNLALGGILFLALVVSGFRAWANLLEPLVGRPSPQVGRLAPGFSLPDASGRTVSLTEFRWVSSVVLLLAKSYQSGVLERQLQELYTQERGLGVLSVEVVAITTDKAGPLPPRLRGLSQPFHLLFDPEGEAIGAFQLDGGGQTLPAAFVIDRHGKIRFRYVGSHAEDGASVSTILNVLGKLQ